jgi:uracil-DNA glycosylase
MAYMSEMKLHPSWMEHIGDEFSKSYMIDLRDFLKKELKSGKLIFPQPQNYFAALDATPFDKIKAVIIGQDPYHGHGQAHGLSFSVHAGIPKPPSLLNIFKELKSDLGIEIPQNGNLLKWSEQGVLLLNNVLTVEEGQPASHQKQGWEQFTDRIVNEVNQKKQHVVFILWGAHAQKKANQVDRQRHHVIESPHPSPLSSHRGFFGSKPFSKTNRYLQQKGISPIDWRIDFA